MIALNSSRFDFLRCISVFLLWSGSKDSRDLCMLTKSTVYTEQSKHRSVVRIHMNVKAFIHHQFCRKYEYHISTYEFPRTLRLLLSPSGWHDLVLPLRLFEKWNNENFSVAASCELIVGPSWASAAASPGFLRQTIWLCLSFPVDSQDYNGTV